MNHEEKQSNLAPEELQTKLAELAQQLTDARSALDRERASAAVRQQIAELDPNIHGQHIAGEMISREGFLWEDGRLTHPTGLTVKQALDQFLAAHPEMFRDYDGSLEDAERSQLARLFGKKAIGREANALAQADIKKYRQLRARAIELGIIHSQPVSRPAKPRAA